MEENVEVMTNSMIILETASIKKTKVKKLLEEKKRDIQNKKLYIIIKKSNTVFDVK